MTMLVGSLVIALFIFVTLLIFFLVRARHIAREIEDLNRLKSIQHSEREAFQMVYHFDPTQKPSPRQTAMVEELLRLRAKEVEKNINSQCKTIVAAEKGKSGEFELQLEQGEVDKAMASFSQAYQALKPFAEQLGIQLGEDYLDYLDPSHSNEEVWPPLPPTEELGLANTSSMPKHTVADGT